jgi:hypothetical protein
VLQRLLRRTALAVIAVSCPWAVNGALAQERTAIQGVWSTAFTTRDHPAFMIEDHLCPLCPPAALEHLRKLLADPANDKRPLQQLAQETNRLATEQRTGVLTDAGRARLKENNAAANAAVIRCEPPDLLTLLRAPQPIVFTLNEDHVVIHHDHWNTVRKIALAGQSTPPDVGPTRLGSSTARFDGPTLIVETRNLLGTAGGGFTTSDKARIVERWTTSRDGTRLTLELTIDDPESYRQPLVLIASRVRTPNDKILDLPPCEAISGQP